jgi:hypothetical protein
MQPIWKREQAFLDANDITIRPSVKHIGKTSFNTKKKAWEGHQRGYNHCGRAIWHEQSVVRDHWRRNGLPARI